MAVTKKSVAFDETVAREAVERARERGFSASSTRLWPSGCRGGVGRGARVGHRHPTPLTPRLVLDTGGADRPRARRCTGTASITTRTGTTIAYPRRHGSNQVLAPLDSELPLRPATARQVGGLRSRAGVGSDTDAVVVLEALAVPGSAILTGDPDDIHALLAVSGSAGGVPVLRV